MAYNQIVLDLDPTGLNIDNKIINEPHSLSNRPNRGISPKLGPFFGEGLIVNDGATILTRGVDYQVVELHQEATLLYGKEIASVILIINQNVSSFVTITYQALGGHFTYSDEAVKNLYESVINDNRPVDWTNVLNKPTEFNPAIHRHLLDDIYGFEPVVDYLERIKRAITLGQVDIVLEIIQILLSKFKCKELPKIIPSNKLMQYDAFLFFLSRRKMIYDIWVDKKECLWVKGTSVNLEVDTSGYPPGTLLYWELYKPDMNIGLYTCKNGYFLTNGGIKEITLYIPSNPFITDTPIYLGIKHDPSDEDYKAVTYVLDVNEYPRTNSGYGYMLFNSQDSTDFDLSVSEYDANDEVRLWRSLTYY